ncbi:hypothetical protein PsYK624_154780 [Phanerochaete sordida]|uniref:Uncharacterized protein n=1 Tax=Phanerochaete sordida TaxID=48140 RepID=A0A9P3GNX7_9APHY|nr:hypothetical protein PsYK624_154780 [Phanerochaete sordida]
MVVVILGTVPLATNLFGWIRSEVVWESGSVCDTIYTFSEQLDKTAIALDAIVLAATWAKSFRHFREMRRVNFNSSVTNVLLRDGTLYFVALLAINIIQILTFSNNLFFSDYMTFILQSLAANLLPTRIASFLNTSPLAHCVGESSAGARLPGSRLSFRVPSSFLGNLGEPLEHGILEEPEDYVGEEGHSEPAQEEHTSD